MKLLTKEIENKLEKTPYGSTDGLGMEAPVIVKYFDPQSSATWLITEGERNGNDWLLYGYCYIHEWEWGSVALSELQNYKGRYGLGIERDLYVTGNVGQNVR